MATTGKLLLTALGLFMVTGYVNPEPIQVFGKHTSDNPLKQLDNLQAEKRYLEKEIASSEPGEQLNLLKMRLIRTNYWINEIMDTSKVLYKDYLQMMSEQEERLQKAGLRTDKEEEQGLNRKKDGIATEFAYRNLHLKRITEEKDQLKKEREDMMQKLKEAQDLHSLALEAIVANTQEGYKLASIPHKNEIKLLRSSLTELASNGSDDQVNGLLETQSQLECLLQKLYEESQLSADTDFKALEDELAEMERQSLRMKNTHNDRKKNIVQNLKNKELADCSAEEMASLKQVHREMAETQENLQEIARRSANLKAISQVTALLTECSNAIKDAKATVASNRGKSGSNLPLLANQTERLASMSVAGKGQEIQDVILQKGLLYKDLLKLYRVKLRTEILDGLAKVNKFLPIPLPGCSITRLVEVRDGLSKWAERVQYALRLSKTLDKYDNKYMIVKLFFQFLTNLRNALFTLAGKKVNQETDLDCDEEKMQSVEEFKGSERDFYKNYQYVKVHSTRLLDIDEQFDEERLKDFRSNFLFVRKVPDVLSQLSETTLNELRANPSEGNKEKQLEGLDSILEEMESYYERLHQLFSVLLYRVKTTTEMQRRRYQAALEEYQQCRLGLFKSLSLFRKTN